MFLGLRFFLDELVFIQTRNSSTTESSSFKIVDGESEVIVRVYEAKNAGYCVVFFPGRSGGAQRYEGEVFKHVLNMGVSIYAISLPGYDGASGRSTFEKALVLGRKALERINEKTSCQISESVFVGRSLGAAIAVELSVSSPPLGILADSVAPSLSVALRAKLKERWLTLPAAYLPIEEFMSFNPSFEQTLPLSNSSIVVLQGSADLAAPYVEVKAALSSTQNAKVIEVKGATHSNTHILGRSIYLRELEGLFKEIADRKSET